MSERKTTPRKKPVGSSKQEMLTAYEDTLKSGRADKVEKPEEKLERLASNEAIAEAELLISSGVPESLQRLRTEFNSLLNQLSDRLTVELDRYKSLNRSITAKEKELEEIYEIKRTASSLTALLEIQEQKRWEFETEMTEKQAGIDKDIDEGRLRWEREKQEAVLAAKEFDQSEKKRREREREEFLYSFNREQQQLREQLATEKAALEREISIKRETFDKELRERQELVESREHEYAELKSRVEKFPLELETAVKDAVDRALERHKLEASSREEIMKREVAGERNVFNARIEALEKALQEQLSRSSSLSQQIEKAYSQVQDVAVKAIDGSAAVKSLSGFSQIISEQIKKASPERSGN